MADRPPGGSGPEKGTPEYDWLYGTSTSGGAGGSRRPSGNPDDESTQVFRPGGEPAAGSGSRGGPDPYDLYGRGEGSGSDRTQSIPAVGGDQRRGDPYGRTEPPPRRPVPPPAAPPGLPPRSKRARRRPRFRARYLLVLLVLWLVFLLVVPIIAYFRIDRVDAFPDQGRPDEQPGVTYLIVGSDSREDLSEDEREELATGNAAGRRTDTIMLLHVGSGPNLLMSIPRDSNVEIPGRGTNKINAAYAFGGPRLLTRTVEANTGIRVDHYVEIGFGGFVNIVDGVGGIEICPDQAIDDPLAGLDVRRGCQDVDGDTALGYARTRQFQTGDIERAANQREVVAAVGDKALSPWSVINPVRWWRLNIAAAGSLRVSEGTGPYALSRFAFAMTNVGGEDGLTCGVPISDLAVTWDPERSEQMFARIRDDQTERIGRQLCTASGLQGGP